MAYRYIKMMPVTVSLPLIPFVTAFLGTFLLTSVIWPILSFQLFYATISGTAISPLPDELVAAVRANEQRVDLTKASNWFPTSTTKKTVTPVDTYTLTIPKLGIKNARVKIGSDDLTQNLVHYAGSELPGKYGNTVIFGHSVLPQFFNPNNYLTIFSTLPTLKEGDTLSVNFDGVEYEYEVIGRRVTDPGDVSGLEQRFDSSYVTLVTCVPPGTYLKRLWLTARQKSLNS